MEGNSIRSNLSKDDIISDISLCLGADIHRENVYLIVEGEDDISLIHPYLSDNVLLYESYDGKHGVEFIVNERFAGNARVIGIRDKDYQVEPVSERIFYYDFGCMEMMLVANDDVFNNLCFEYYRGNDSSNEIRKCILEQLKFLSIIRMSNEREQWGIILRGVSINSAWNPEEGVVDNELIVQKINLMNNDFIDDHTLQEINEKYLQDWNDEDYFSYTQGHDFTTLFAAMCNENRKRAIKYTEVEASARCIFRWSDLVKTDLFFKLNEYSQMLNLRILKGVS